MVSAALDAEHTDEEKHVAADRDRAPLRSETDMRRPVDLRRGPTMAAATPEALMAGSLKSPRK